MTTAREIIARACPWGERNPTSLAVADEVIVSLAFAGFRIVGPDEVDAVTVEKCAEVADLCAAQEKSEVRQDGVKPGASATAVIGHIYAMAEASAIATAIRTLAEEKRP